MLKNTKKLVLTALLIAIGVILPQLFHTIPNAGSIFLPMHIPTFIAGFIVGPIYGLLCGIITPLLSHLIFHMPPAPILLSMLIELGTYGLITGLAFLMLKIKNINVKIYVSLIVGMLCGRIVYGLLNAFIFKAGSYSLNAWLTAAFITALPGIIIQLIIIPILVRLLMKNKLLNN